MGVGDEVDYCDGFFLGFFIWRIWGVICIFVLFFRVFGLELFVGRGFRFEFSKIWI